MTKLLIDETPHQVVPSLASAIGLNEAIFLQQLHFLIQERATNEYDGYFWWIHTTDQWLERFPYWSEKTIKRIITSLKKLDLLIAEKLQYKAFGIKADPTCWYRINYESLAKIELSEKPKKAKNPSGSRVVTRKGQNDPIRKGQVDPIREGQNDPILYKNKNKKIVSKSVNNTREAQILNTEEISFADRVMAELLADNLPASKKRYADLKIREYQERFPDSLSVADCWAYVVQAVSHQHGLTGS